MTKTPPRCRSRASLCTPAAVGRDLVDADADAAVDLPVKPDPGVQLAVKVALAMERQNPLHMAPPPALPGVERVCAAAANAVAAIGGHEDSAAVGVQPRRMSEGEVVVIWDRNNTI